MSASRPKKGIIIPRKSQVDEPSFAKQPASKKSAKSTSIRRARPPQSNSTRPIGEPKIRDTQYNSNTVNANKEKARAVPPPVSSAPISVHSSSAENDEEDDLVEVPIPSVAGPSSPYPGTPTTPGNLTKPTTPATGTTAPSIDDDCAGYGEGDDGNEEGTQGTEAGVIRLEIGGELPEDRAKRISMAMRKKPMTSKDRAVRLEAHKVHVVALLASARIRNRWCCHMLLKARLLSLLPHPLQSAFNIPPSRFPDRAQRSRLFYDALQSLATWWSLSFFDIPDLTVGMRTRPWDEVQGIVNTLPRLTKADMFGSSFGEQGQDWEHIMKTIEQGAGGERLRSPNSMMKKVLQQEGSRDVSSQLFVALARACGLGARLVVSLQVIPWRAEQVVQKKKSGAGQNGRTLATRQGNGQLTQEEEDEDDEMEEVPIPDENGNVSTSTAEAGKPEGKRPTIRAAGKRRLQDPADLYRLRRPKPTPQQLGNASAPKRKVKEDLSSQPPVFWAEIFSRSDQRWIPVDPVRGTIRKKTHFEPVTDSGPVRMLYVVAFEEDDFARDVTLRYTKNFGAKTIKLRVPSRKDEPDWWGGVMGFLERPYKLNRDLLEDAEFETSQVSESMPAHMGGFKDHPIYVLERHLKREEVITPKREIGRFKGEPVYRRQNVVLCKTAETWMRQGRRVKSRQEPLKWVKQRAVTLQKRRAQELSMQESGEEIQQGLYAEWQTEVYRPPPIQDGIIPKNSFGNIDLYAPTMLPAGSVHLSYKGIAKVVKSLGISYAEACTGFEFKKQRAIPVITGIVVAEENEGLVLDAYWESAAAAEERERAKKEERALKRWTKLINGLRVRARLQAEYGTGERLQEQQVNPLADMRPAPAGTSKKTAASVIANATREADNAWSIRVRDKSPSAEPADDTVPALEVVAGVPTPDTRLSPATEHTGHSKPKDLLPVGEADDSSPNVTQSIPKLNISQKQRAFSRSGKRAPQSPAGSDAETTGSEKSRPPPRAKRTRASVKPASTVSPAPTRILRIRAPTNEAQKRQQEVTRRKMKEALARDAEEDKE